MSTEARVYDSKGSTVATFSSARVAVLVLPALARSLGEAVHLQVSGVVPSASLPPIHRGCWHDVFGPKCIPVITCRP